jgi:1,4-dihydroxy-2-naphthoate octaprenyltransferase
LPDPSEAAPAASTAAEPTAAKLWLLSLRAPFLIASLIPATLGIVFAYQQVGVFDGQLAALTLVGIALIHLANNMLNDNFDFRSGADQAVEHQNPFAGGGRVLITGKLSIRTHLAIASALLAGGTAIGFLLVFLIGGLESQAGQVLLVIGAIGLGTALFYVGPPLRLAHHGVGEVAVGVSFGPLVVLGSYVVQARDITMGAVWLSLAMGLLITGILWINEFPDLKADLSVGKRTAMARLGPERSVRVFEGILVGAFACPPAAVLLGSAPPTVLVALLTAPVAIKVVKTAREHYGDPMALIPANGGTVLLTALFGVLLIVGIGVAPLLGI